MKQRFMGFGADSEQRPASDNLYTTGETHTDLEALRASATLITLTTLVCGKQSALVADLETH